MSSLWGEEKALPEAAQDMRVDIPSNLEQLHLLKEGASRSEIFALVQQWSELELLGYWLKRNRQEEYGFPLVDWVPNIDVIDSICEERLRTFGYVLPSDVTLSRVLLFIWGALKYPFTYWHSQRAPSSNDSNSTMTETPTLREGDEDDCHFLLHPSNNPGPRMTNSE